MEAISLCMIVKNEEKNLTACLTAIKPYMNEIIIVDTGSTDHTKEIALQFTDQVYDFTWINDFAAARNFSISKAGNEYILVLDSDEVVADINLEELRLLMLKHPKEIGRVLCNNIFTRGNHRYQSTERISRLFSKKYYRYQGTIHEQLISIDSGDVEIEGNTYDLPLEIHHFGYEGDLGTRQKKAKRNIALLEQALSESPDDPYLLYQLGKSYYMEEEYLKASGYFGQALSYDLDIRLEYVQDMVESYGYSLMNSAQYETAMQLLNVYEEFSHSADFIFMIALVLMNSGHFAEAIEEFKKAAKKKTCKMAGVNDYLAYYNIAAIYECLGQIEDAKNYYRKCKLYLKSINREIPD